MTCWASTSGVIGGQPAGGQPLGPGHQQQRQQPRLQRPARIHERHRRRDQRQRAHQVGPGAGHPYRDGAAQRVAEQVHRAAAGVLDPADHPVGHGRRSRSCGPGRCSPNPGRSIASPSSRSAQQVGQVGPVQRRAAEAVHVQGRLGVRPRSPGYAARRSTRPVQRHRARPATAGMHAVQRAGGRPSGTRRARFIYQFCYASSDSNRRLSAARVARTTACRGSPDTIAEPASCSV